MDDHLGCGSRCQVVVGTWGGCPVEWLKYSSRQELPPIKILLNDWSGGVLELASLYLLHSYVKERVQFFLPHPPYTVLLCPFCDICNMCQKIQSKGKTDRSDRQTFGTFGP